MKIDFQRKDSLIELITSHKLFVLVTYPKAALDNIQIPISDKQFLEKIGLPERAAPHLYFGEFGEGQCEQWLPKMKEWNWLVDMRSSSPISLENRIIIGSRNSPICILENGQIFLLDQDQSYREIYINENVQSLLSCSAAFQYMINLGLETAGDDAAIENRIPIKLVRDFLDQLVEIDPKAALPESFWHLEAMKKMSNSILPDEKLL